MQACEHHVVEHLSGCFRVGFQNYETSHIAEKQTAVFGGKCGIPVELIVGQSVGLGIVGEIVLRGIVA